MKTLKATNKNTLYTEYLVIFLLAMDFFHASNIILVLLLVYGLVKIYLKNKTIIINLELLFLVFYSFFYFLIFSLTSSGLITNLVYYLIGPVGIYIIGQELITNFKDRNRQLMIVLLLVGLGYFIHGALNMYTNINSINFEYSTEIIIDFWSNTGVLRTLQGVYFTILTSLLFVVLFVRDKDIKLYWRFLIVIATIFSIWSTLLLGNRTLIFIAGITFICSGLIYIGLTKKKFTSLLKILLVCLLLFVLINFDIGSIKTFILDSKLFTRFDDKSTGMLDSSRWEYYGVFLNTFYQYPFGVNLAGDDILSFPYMHNVWLDIYIQVGLIPSILFIFFTLSSVRNVTKIMGNANASITVKISISAVLIGLLTNFMVEPIINANIYYFLTFCLLAGVVKSYLNVEKNGKKNEG